VEDRQTSFMNEALTSFVGVAGKSCIIRDGILYYNSKTRFADILDGASNTLIVGERPPLPGSTIARWYGGWPGPQSGESTQFLGVAERLDYRNFGCFASRFTFSEGKRDSECDVYHFWSLHSGGANFVFADGSVHFLKYSAAPIMPMLASRAGGEPTPSFD
jgi:prepilin-type processing-associated H-X9-DG protein